MSNPPPFLPPSYPLPPPSARWAPSPEGGKASFLNASEVKKEGLPPSGEGAQRAEGGG
jgi:hypothetical protein